MEALAHPVEAVRRAMTAEELWELCATGDDRFELIDGELVKTPLAGLAHGLALAALGAELRAYARPKRLGRAFARAGFVLHRNPDTVLGPDIAFVREAAFRGPLPENGFWEGAPDLVAEVVSPDDTASELQDRIRRYLTAGVRVVWVVYPLPREARVHSEGEPVQVIMGDGALDGGEVLPGFRLALSELWD